MSTTTQQLTNMDMLKKSHYKRDS